MAAVTTKGEFSPVAAPRRREAERGSARQYLLTLITEFVFPRGDPVWAATFLTALREFGIDEMAARQALARTAADGRIAAERVGRRTRWRLTELGRRRAERLRTRIFSFMLEQRPWDGQWLVVSVTVPEQLRHLRYRLRTQLTWNGFGSPAPGLWVSPDASKAADMASIFAELGVADRAFTWIGPLDSEGEIERLVAAAWSLDDVEERYTAFIRKHGSKQVQGQQGAFAAQVELVREWRRLPSYDPALPAELLGRTWPGPAAAQLFHDRHEGWHVDAQAHWERICAAAETT